MNVVYRPAFLRDLKKLKKQKSVFAKIYEMAFETLPNEESLQTIPGVKAMTGYPGAYRIRLGQYRIGIEVVDDTVDVMRVLHRREFYRYFPK